MPQAAKYPIEAFIRQSLPVDFSRSVDDLWIKDKTVVITGGASGFGEGFFRRWAAAGATVVIGDINIQKGDQLVRNVRQETGNSNLHFCYCDVTQWQSQVQFFKDAVKVSPHGGIDTVVANAGIVDPNSSIEAPEALDAAEPPPPSLRVLDVNMIGVMYTTHLALFYLPRNPNSLPATQSHDPRSTPRDRHLLLISSIAGLSPFPGQTLYGVSKHAVVGLFRSLRCTSFAHGVRVNMLCPYFIDTPLFVTAGRLNTAGGEMGTTEDVVNAATRFVADVSILGRAAVIGPQMKVKQDANGEWRLVEDGAEAGESKAIWEAYADDLDDSELFVRNYVRLLNRVVEMRGWSGWIMDVFVALRRTVGWS